MSKLTPHEKTLLAEANADKSPMLDMSLPGAVDAQRIELLRAKLQAAEAYPIKCIWCQLKMATVDEAAEHVLSCDKGPWVALRSRAEAAEAENKELIKDYAEWMSPDDYTKLFIQRDNALDDLKAEIANHREDSAALESMRETAKEASRVHIEMHNQIIALQAEVARLRETEGMAGSLNVIIGLRTRIAELEAEVARMRDAMETDLIYVTSRMDEHPEGYEGACWCRSCCSYATDDGDGK